jgi:Zn finger protein HypA/HybF involved in hydrogenase expression
MGVLINVKESTPCVFFQREGEEPRDSRHSMGGVSGRGAGTPMVLVMLLMLPLLAGVQAQGGGALLDDASFNLNNGTTFSNETLDFTFEVHETAGQEANVTAHLVAQTLEGVEVSNSSFPISGLAAFEQRNVSASLLSMPFGYSQVSVSLTGDVGVNTSTQTTSITRTVQRLRPLSISLAGASAVLFEGETSEGQSTGNLSVHDGDYVSISLPIINEGDVDWTGGLTVELMNGGSNETLVSSNLLVNGSESIVVQLRPSLQVAEGPLEWMATLSGDLGDPSGTHAVNGTLSVLAPPLPVLEALITSNADAVEAGDVLEIDVEFWNNGTAGFEGFAICVDGGQELLNETVSIPSGTSIETSFQLTARPLELQCGVGGARIGDASTLPQNASISMSSAVFESAGASSPDVAGGPWHKGDSVSANMLIRNTGALEGRIRLNLEASGQTSSGDWVVLKSGAASEVSAMLQFVVAGNVDLNWALESDDGVVSGMREGSTVLAVETQQSVSMAVRDVQRGESDAVEFELELILDDGQPRDVQVQVGYDTGDATVFLLDYVVQLQPGSFTETYTLGDVQGEDIVVQISAVQWLIGPGPLSISSDLPAASTTYWLEFATTTSPLRPVQSDTTTVSVSFKQSGPQGKAAGEVWIVDSYGVLLSKTDSPAWNGKSEQVLNLDVAWPKGSTVALQALWHVDGDVISAQASYVSGEVVVDDSFNWPWAAMGWGLLLGLGVVLIARLRQGRSNDGSSPSSQPSSERSESKGHSSKIIDEEKREISCPECDRRLRVPVSYSGSVGCPDCAMKFKVEAEQPEPAPVEAVSDQESIEAAPELKKNDGKIEIGCPDCSQSLRIPSSYQGSVRCPACKKIFKASEGFAHID